MKKHPTRLGFGVHLSVLCFAASVVSAQSSTPMVFVSNNGNLEGSVTALRIEPDGSLDLVNRVITGTRTSTSLPCAGCNAYSVAVSPDGRFVAASHAAGDAPLPDGISIFEVAADGSIALSLLYPLYNLGSPLDILWVSETHIAVTRTNLSGGSQVATYRFNPATPSLTFVDVEAAGSFSTALDFDAGGRFLYAQDSTGYRVYGYAVSTSGQLTPTGNASSASVYPLGIGLAPDGSRLYGGGGISSGSHAICGFSLEAGVPSLMPQSPFYSPGTSPKQVVVEGSGAFAFAAHGTDATIRTFSVDPRNGGLVATGGSYDVGVQGSLGEIASLGELLFATDRDTIGDGRRGVGSFAILDNGSLLPIGGFVDTEGITPNGVAAWAPGAPPCPADLNGDGIVNASDLADLLASWNGRGSADLDGDGTVGPADLAQLLASWGPCGA